ncbi:MAG: TGS domain-containing protein, partial [Candidatus Cloacimonetes bacterium]|nr:TGS domain-containing protein [Candidatus Cloacimonadota bacterium]
MNITFPDGAIKEYPKNITPIEIAESISHGLAKQIVVAKVNDELVDLNFEIVEDAKIMFFKFDSEEGRSVYWHSTAHLLA